jgi:lipoprotein NlpD
MPSRLILPALLTLVSCAAAAPAVSPAPRSAASHVVQPGETLWRIARSYDMSVDELKRLNDLDDPTKVRIGARLEVRSPAPPPAPASASTEVAAVAPSAPPPSDTKRDAPGFPLRWPVDGQITSRYGQRGGQPHDGIDIDAPEGTPVRAAAPGRVLFAARHEGYGNLVVLKHDSGLVTVYAHHQQNLVRKGQHVAIGQQIAKVGSTGNASGPHLHFEVRQGTAPQNPLKFLPP